MANQSKESISYLDLTDLPEHGRRAPTLEPQNSHERICRMISAWAPPHDTGYGRAALSRIALQARLPSQTSRYSEPYTTNSLCARTPTRHPHAVKTIMSKRTDQITTPRPGKGGLRRGPQSVSCKGGGRGASHPSLRHVSYPSRLPSLNAPALLAQHVRSCLKLWIMLYSLFILRLRYS